MDREDARGNNLFEGGFLGLDNIGPLDRSHLPVGGILEQPDATGWMAAYALSMCAIAAALRQVGKLGMLQPSTQEHRPSDAREASNIALVLLQCRD